MQPLVEYRESFGGFSTRVLELEGDGPPLLLIHGYADSADTWRLVLDELARRDRRAIAIDLPGFGRADRLVLVSAAGISFAEAEGRQAEAAVRTFEATVPFFAGAREHWVRRPLARKLAFGRVFRYPNRVRPELLAEQIHPSVRAPGFGDSIRAIGGYDTRHRLPEIEIPTMVVWGMNDKIVPPEAAIGYHRYIEHSRLEIFERTGHVPQMERPARFNAVLEDFLGE